MLTKKKIILFILIAISPPIYSRSIVIHNGYWNISFEAKNEQSISTYTDYYTSKYIPFSQYLICFLNEATISLVSQTVAIGNETFVVGNKTVVIENDLHYRKKFKLDNQKKPLPGINKDNFESILKLLKGSKNIDKSDIPHIKALVRTFSPWAYTTPLFLERLEYKLKAANTSRKLTLCPERIDSIYYQAYTNFSVDIVNEEDIHIYLNQTDEQSTFFAQEFTTRKDHIKLEKKLKKACSQKLIRYQQKRRLAQLKPIAPDELSLLATVLTGAYGTMISCPTLGGDKKNSPHDKHVAATRIEMGLTPEGHKDGWYGGAGYSSGSDG
ncbi:MAG: hypothetical protein PUP46_07565 [Endozoicomonas sp. (ex Botrylloides leachii)]|nr:hypothetical protein [Endozoicomonas sp. (ex Botrylloides leachii)]